MLKQNGRIFLWQYTENISNYPGWNLCADSEGCDYLLKNLNILAVAQRGSLLVTLSSPTPNVLSVPNNKNGTAKLLSHDKFEICLDAAAGNKDLWDFTCRNNSLVFRVGFNWLMPIQEGIRAVANGSGDYCMGGHKSASANKLSNLWFWWYLK